MVRNNLLSACSVLVAFLSVSLSYASKPFDQCILGTTSNVQVAWISYIERLIQDKSLPVSIFEKILQSNEHPIGAIIKYLAEHAKSKLDYRIFHQTAFVLSTALKEPELEAIKASYRIILSNKNVHIDEVKKQQQLTRARWSMDSVEWVSIPAGSFFNTNRFGDRERVEIQNPFRITKRFITADEWLAVMGDVPAQSSGEKDRLKGRAAHYSFYAIAVFANRLSEEMGYESVYEFHTPISDDFLGIANGSWRYNGGVKIKSEPTDSSRRLGFRLPDQEELLYLSSGLGKFEVGTKFKSVRTFWLEGVYSFLAVNFPQKSWGRDFANRFLNHQSETDLPFKVGGVELEDFRLLGIKSAANFELQLDTKITRGRWYSPKDLVWPSLEVPINHRRVVPLNGFSHPLPRDVDGEEAAWCLCAECMYGLGALSSTSLERNDVHRGIRLVLED